MSRAPAFQFYTGDWRKDPAVQALDHEHKGVWIDLLCILHDSPDRGRLILANGQPMPDPAIARNLGLSEAKWKQIRSTLVAYGVAQEDEGGTLYNRRMVREEEVRRKRAEAGRKGGKKSKPSKSGSKREAKGEAKRGSSTSSSTSTTEKTDTSKSEPIFDLWGVWLEELGGKPPQPNLTRKRRQKLMALYDEHLSDEDDPPKAFRRILKTIKSSDHHMSQRSYQMPESTFRNEERRDRWAMAAKGDGGPSGGGWEDEL